MIIKIPDRLFELHENDALIKTEKASSVWCLKVDWPPFPKIQWTNVIFKHLMNSSSTNQTNTGTLRSIQENMKTCVIFDVQQWRKALKFIWGRKCNLQI